MSMNSIQWPRNRFPLVYCHSTNKPTNKFKSIEVHCTTVKLYTLCAIHTDDHFSIYLDTGTQQTKQQLSIQCIIKCRKQNVSMIISIILASTYTRKKLQNSNRKKHSTLVSCCNFSHKPFKLIETDETQTPWSWSYFHTFQMEMWIQWRLANKIPPHQKCRRNERKWNLSAWWFLHWNVNQFFQW